MANTITNPNSNILTRDVYEIFTRPVKGEDDGYKAGDVLTFDGSVYSLSDMDSGDNHTESFAVVYEDIGSNVESGVIVELGGVREGLLSDTYQNLSDDDKKVVRKELNSKKIFIEE